MRKNYILFTSIIVYILYMIKYPMTRMELSVCENPKMLEKKLIPSPRITWSSHAYRILKNVPSQFDIESIGGCYFYDKYILLFDLKKNYKIWFFLRNGYFSHELTIPSAYTISEFKWMPEVPVIWYAEKESCFWYIIELTGRVIDSGNYVEPNEVIQQIHPVLQQAGNFYFRYPYGIIQVFETSREQIVIQGIDSNKLDDVILTPEWILIPESETLVRVINSRIGDQYSIPLLSEGNRYHFGDLYPQFVESDNFFNLVSAKKYEQLLKKHARLNRSHLPAALKKDEVLLVQRKLKEKEKIN